MTVDGLASVWALVLFLTLLWQSIDKSAKSAGTGIKSAIDGLAQAIRDKHVPQSISISGATPPLLETGTDSDNMLHLPAPSDDQTRFYMECAEQGIDPDVAEGTTMRNVCAAWEQQDHRLYEIELSERRLVMRAIREQHPRRDR